MTIFICFLYNIVIIIIVNKEKEVKGGSRIYFEVFGELKKLAAQEPELLECITEAAYREWNSQKGEVRLNDAFDDGRTCGICHGLMHT